MMTQNVANRACVGLLLSCLALAVARVSSAQLDSSHWRILDVSSENVLTGEQVRGAIDGAPETQWHTQWHDARQTPPAEPPHVLTIDFQETHTVSEVRYRARAHGEGGLPKKYLLELSTDGAAWNRAADGEFRFRSQMSPHAIVKLEQPVQARYLRLTTESLHESAKSTEPGLVVGELDVATAENPLVPTTLLPVPQSREWNIGGYVWRDRHRDLLAYAARHKVRLVLLGDSITHRWGAPPHDSTPRTGEEVWNKFYGHRLALCLGYGWDRVENMLWRLQHGELEDADPQLVVLMAGTNNLEVNTPEEIADGVAGLCDEIHRQKPQASILLLAIFPRGENRKNPELEETNRRLSKLGQRPYVTFKDIGNVFEPAGRAHPRGHARPAPSQRRRLSPLG